MPAVLVVTTEGVPGYQVTSVIGQVVGSIARLSNAFTEGIRTMDGQLNPRRSQDLAQWRTDAINAMIEEARKQGANAVVGMRFDNRGISTAWAEICAYGTAVRVDPHDRPPDVGQAAPVQPPRAEPAAAPPPPGDEPPPPAGAEPAAAPPRDEPPRDQPPRDEPPRDEPPPREERAAGDEPPGAQPGSARAPQAAQPEIEPSATGWPDEPGPEASELVGPERLKAEEPDPDWPDTPTDPTLRMPD